MPRNKQEYVCMTFHHLDFIWVKILYIYHFIEKVVYASSYVYVFKFITPF